MVSYGLVNPCAVMFVGKIPLDWRVITALLYYVFSIHVPPPPAAATAAAGASTNNNQLKGV